MFAILQVVVAIVLVCPGHYVLGPVRCRARLVSVFGGTPLHELHPGFRVALAVGVGVDWLSRRVACICVSSLAVTGDG